MEETVKDHSDFWVIGWIIFIALIALGGGGVATNIGSDPPDDDPTGLCNRPTAQLNC